MPDSTCLPFSMQSGGAGANCQVSPQLKTIANCNPWWHDQFMEAKAKQHNHLREWREFRSLTQTQLAETIGTKGSVISLLESGSRSLSDKWLRRIAPALNTTPGHLLDHNPNDLPTDVLDVWADVPEERREQALQVLSTFRQVS
jgi:transcriptional regulator with XRE-family HTH domain